MRLLPPDRWANWTDPSPITKQIVTSLFFSVVIAVNAFVPELRVIQPEGLLPAFVCIVVATALSILFTLRERWWRYGPLSAALGFVAIAILQVAADSIYAPVLGLTVLPVIYFAGEVERRNVAYAVFGVLCALLGPALVSDPRSRTEEIFAAFFMTVVLAFVATVVHEVARGHRAATADVRRLSSARDDLLLNDIKQGEAVELTLRGLWSAVTEQAAIGTDLAGLIDQWNPGAEKMLGLSSVQTVGVRTIDTFHVVDELVGRERELGITDDDEAMPGFRALTNFARRGTAEVRDWTYIRATGDRFPGRLSVTPRLGKWGEPVGYLFVVNDTTEAREAAKLKDEFVGLISHELRTPLSSILGYIELMRDETSRADALSETQLRYLEVAERNARRLLSLVGDLLFTTQVESGKFTLDVGELDLSPIVAAAVQSAGPVGVHAGIAIIPSISPEVMVEGDAVRLAQAVDNLVSNAIKYTPRGGTVTVSLAAVDGNAVVTVRDTGIGIPAAEMERLFSRFFRASTATNNAIAGIGLGLTITRAIITAHHGEVAVNSVEGVGTSFSFTVPLSRCQPERGLHELSVG